MASIFDDFFGALTGQQAVPQQTIIPTGDLLGQAYRTAISQAPNIIAYNQALAPGLTDVQLGVERQFDPNVANLRAATSGAILNQLGLGEEISPELAANIRRTLLETGAATGFGVSPAGIGNVAIGTAREREARGRARRAEAQGYVRSSPSLSSLYQPTGILDPGAIAADIRGVQAAQDNLANLQEDIRRKNFSSLINTGGRIAGTVAGGIFGGGLGAQLGGQIGGSVFQGSGVRGYEAPQQEGSLFGSLLNVFGGIGGPQYGIGAGAQYVDPRTGRVLTSTRASPIANV